jgi:hypothetical protein
MEGNGKGMSYGEYIRRHKEISDYYKALDRALETPEKPLENGRPEMLPKIAPYFEMDESRYPETIRVSFSDGHTAIYQLKVEQPHPMIVENIRIIRKWKTGYQAPAERRRRRR